MIPRPLTRRPRWRLPTLGQALHRGRSFTRIPDEGISVATPLPFAPKAKSSLLPLSLKDTTSILTPEWAHLSPCFGAALTTTPMIGNLLRLSACVSYERNSVLSNSAILADQLFFQMIREAPIFMTRTKSMPAAYLTPEMIGGVLGGLHNDPNVIHKYLKERYGIQSNKINGTEWTGVSLARWMDLFTLSSRSSSCNASNKTTHWMPLAVWLVALWETSHSKLCWLDYMLECDRQIQARYNQSIFQQNGYTKAILSKDPIALDEWQSKRFCPKHDLSKSKVQASLDTLICFCDSQTSFNNMESDQQWQDISRAMEVVCASVALGQIPVHGPKPSVPNGYYGYDGGVLTADCVEVTVREIMDLLLWEEGSGKFDLTRLPPTASPELAAFYKKLSQHNTAEDVESTNFEFGKEWFEMLSDLPGCHYFESGPDHGKPYELAPTMESVAKVCHQLLVTDTASSSHGGNTWTSLHDLSNFWKAQPLQVESDTLTHRISSSEQAARHEFATLQICGNPSSIELRMRCDWSEKSGFSVVTHLRERRNHLGKARIQKFDQLLLQDRSSDSPISKILAVCLNAEDVGQEQEASQGDDDTELLPLNLLSARFGCDRRGIIVRDRGTDIKSQQRLQEHFIEAEVRESHLMLRAALFRICDLQNNDLESCRVMLIWMLRESPVVVESSLSTPIYSTVDKELELAILSLPPEVLADEMVQQSLWNNNSGLLRGNLLAACSQLKSGKASIFDIVFGDLELREVVSVMSLLYASSQYRLAD